MEVLGHLRCFKVLAVLEFTSERKRMSVLVQEESSAEIRLLTKGADDAINPRLSQTGAPRAELSSSLICVKRF